jgi:biotin transport system substrate-specific component
MRSKCYYHDPTSPVLFHSILTGIGAFITIPIGPVLITQTLFTYLAGGILGGKRGALSQVIYIILGLIGIPFFAGGKAGIGVLVGPTGGCLIGFVIGAYVTGRLIEFRRTSSFIWILFSMVIGTSVIYTLGIIQLSLWLKVCLEKAILIGVLPFIIGDSLKMLLATYITIRVRRLYDC